MWIPVRAPALRSVSDTTELLTCSDKELVRFIGLPLALPFNAAMVVVPEEEKKEEDVALVIEGESEDALDVSVVDS